MIIEVGGFFPFLLFVLFHFISIRYSFFAGVYTAAFEWLCWVSVCPDYVV